MTTLDAFNACQVYLSIKSHFNTDSYDYFKYAGRVSLSKSTFDHRKDRYSFEKLSKRYTLEDYNDLVLSNMVKSPKIYSRDLMTEEASNIFKDHQRKIQSLSYFFKEDIERMILHAERKGMELDELLKVGEYGDYPELLELHNCKSVSMESLIILDKVLNFFPIWNKKIIDNIIWPDKHKLCIKYAPFLHIDIPKYKKLLKEKINGH